MPCVADTQKVRAAALHIAAAKLATIIRCAKCFGR